MEERLKDAVITTEISSTNERLLVGEDGTVICVQIDDAPEGVVWRKSITFAEHQAEFPRWLVVEREAHRLFEWARMALEAGPIEFPGGRIALRAVIIAELEAIQPEIHAGSPLLRWIRDFRKALGAIDTAMEKAA